MLLAVKKPAAFVLAIALYAQLLACSAATVISLIENALTIALEAASVTGVVPPQFVPYVSAALTGIECASTEAATNDSAQVKATKITACLAGAVAPVLPAGTPANVVAIVAKLAQAIQNILSGLPAAAPTARSTAALQTVTPDQRAHLLDMAKQARDARARMVARGVTP